MENLNSPLLVFYISLIQFKHEINSSQTLDLLAVAAPLSTCPQCDHANAQPLQPMDFWSRIHTYKSSSSGPSQCKPLPDKFTALPFFCARL